ncbi:MAG: hypothetical protein KA515_00180 [Candidatus Pacebacteria bacterium]|nr:hypothetical protein [Candidatus Paceibacterota bacterium]
MKKFLQYILIIAIIGIFVPLFGIHAEQTTPPTNMGTGYTLLAPLPCPPDGADCEGGQFKTFKFNSSALSGYLNIMIKIIIGIAGVLAVLMIVIGGIEYMGSELISSKEAGKDRIQNALLGLLIALGAWALLNTINGNLLNSNVNIDKVTIIIDIQDAAPQTPVNGFYKNGLKFGDPITGTKPTLPYFARVYNNECKTIGEPNCTSTVGLVVAPLWSIHNGCPKCGELLITGGTEWWSHGAQSGNTSHQKGSGTVDLDTTPELDNYLSGGKPLVKYQRYGPNNEYYYEGNHWHIGP